MGLVQRTKLVGKKAVTFIVRTRYRYARRLGDICHSGAMTNSTGTQSRSGARFSSWTRLSHP